MLNVEKYDSSFLKITGDYNDKQLISAYFTKPVENFFFHPKYKAGIWDGKIRFYNMATGLLPFGLFEYLFKYLQDSDLEFTISEEIKAEVLPNEISDFDLALKNILLTPRDYQIEGAKLALQYKKAILEHPTGSGKTLTIALIINYLLRKGKKKILIVVPNIGLISQIYSDFKDYGFPVEKLIGKYYGEEKDDTKIITVGTWQSLVKDDKLLANVEAVMVDEAHGTKALEITNLLKKCTNTEYRIGVTGSLHKWETDRWSVIGYLGPVVHKIHTKHLIHKDKVLSPIKIKIFNLEYPKELKKTITEYREEKAVIKAYKPRQILFRKLIENYCKDQNTLIVFDEIELGETYLAVAKEAFPDKTCYWISGDVKGDEREKIRIDTNVQNNVLLFGTIGCVSTGINIPKLHSIIFLYIGKSLIRVKQSIGRGLRLHASKEHLTIFDMADNLKYSKKHLVERMEIYMGEEFPTEIFEVGGKK